MFQINKIRNEKKSYNRQHRNTRDYNEQRSQETTMSNYMAIRWPILKSTPNS